MAIIEEEHRDDWFELSILLDHYFTHYNEYIFRGQADDSWKLEPSLTRAINNYYPITKDKIGLLNKILNSFKKNLRGRCQISLDDIHNDEIWAIGQHFGLFTPLLDWTRSPYIGLFYSLFGECNSGKRALWALEENDVSEFYPADKYITKNERIRIVEPMTHSNSRLVSQNGLFLYVPPTQSIEKCVSDLKKDDGVTMYKITFPDKIKNDALAALNLRNINNASLFPDIEGSAKHSNFEFLIETYLDEMKKTGWPEP